ncbi:MULTISPECIES: WhiB family transcriptional regulator [unclassified Mycolicibacterium]|uniref:WhiB family transcriptional regulator n=1 Tax=unclassified Mycolicibacterium TaxID=2636767 RepID=UPI0012DE663A|nr:MULTISPECIES: WhiB family transcriptional regulator [unclassified Mycolicibacterium]MUL85204.1 WhiB family transcriptional regulator [Mycolicibacterium sp. CBMA 329]MUL91171.1 WhiB family transcriptional regulator [Mycolicibacterium sp. CBMA 331]MUL98160.1 WhiB family transcriptional regulator [Mycolicibacterium sp. CBMA 334]MUM26043.1 WhiB family transcriptional regulator [Mycolicibacterium sp. CBMA 295]MUM40930.1 WhiB family transcriptional regulator [Mycolicibacterium sp. CBMA 247]
MLRIEDDQAWQSRAKCRDQATEVFFPDRVGRSGLRQREEVAKRICRECPVLSVCREHALRLPEDHGVWGAMTAAERSKVRSARSRPR